MFEHRFRLNLSRFGIRLTRVYGSPRFSKIVVGDLGFKIEVRRAWHQRLYVVAAHIVFLHGARVSELGSQLVRIYHRVRS